MCQEKAILAHAINTSEQTSVNRVTGDGVFQTVGTSDNKEVNKVFLLQS